MIDWKQIIAIESELSNNRASAVRVWHYIRKITKQSLYRSFSSPSWSFMLGDGMEARCYEMSRMEMGFRAKNKCCIQSDLLLWISQCCPRLSLKSIVRAINGTRRLYPPGLSLPVVLVGGLYMGRVGE